MHQNFETINRLLANCLPWPSYSLGHVTYMAEADHVIMTDDILEQIARSNDLNDAVGYYAVWLAKRTEANGGVFKRDW